MHAAFRYGFAIRPLPIGWPCAPSQRCASPSAFAKSVCNNIAPFGALCMRIHPLGAGATRFCDDYVSSSYVVKLAAFATLGIKDSASRRREGGKTARLGANRLRAIALLQATRLHRRPPMRETRCWQLPAFPTIRPAKLYRSDAYIQQCYPFETDILPAPCNERRIRCTFRNLTAICKRQFVHILGRDASRVVQRTLPPKPPLPQ